MSLATTHLLEARAKLRLAFAEILGMLVLLAVMLGFLTFDIFSIGAAPN